MFHQLVPLSHPTMATIEPARLPTAQIFPDEGPYTVRWSVLCTVMADYNMVGFP